MRHVGDEKATWLQASQRHHGFLGFCICFLSYGFDTQALNVDSQITSDDDDENASPSIQALSKLKLNDMCEAHGKTHTSK